jgi:hypothetical protein
MPHCVQGKTRQRRTTRERELDHSTKMRIVFEDADGVSGSLQSPKEDSGNKLESAEVCVPGVRILGGDYSNETCLERFRLPHQYIRESRRGDKVTPNVEYDLESDDEGILKGALFAGVSESTFEMAIEALEKTSYEKMITTIRVPPPKQDAIQSFSGCSTFKSCDKSSLHGLTASCFQTPAGKQSRVWEVGIHYISSAIACSWAIQVLKTMMQVNPDDAVCSVCLDSDAQVENGLVLCDGCVGCVGWNFREIHASLYSFSDTAIFSTWPFAFIDQIHAYYVSGSHIPRRPVVFFCEKHEIA